MTALLVIAIVIAAVAAICPCLLGVVGGEPDEQVLFAVPLLALALAIVAMAIDLGAR